MIYHVDALMTKTSDVIFKNQLNGKASLIAISYDPTPAYFAINHKTYASNRKFQHYI